MSSDWMMPMILIDRLNGYGKFDRGSRVSQTCCSDQHAKRAIQLARLWTLNVHRDSQA